MRAFVSCQVSVAAEILMGCESMTSGALSPPIPELGKLRLSFLLLELYPRYQIEVPAVSTLYHAGVLHEYLPLSFISRHSVSYLSLGNS